MYGVAKFVTLLRILLVRKTVVSFGCQFGQTLFSGKFYCSTHTEQTALNWPVLRWNHTVFVRL